MAEELLKIEDLCVAFPTAQGINYAVDHVSFSVNRAEVFGLVGESGCGKSMTALSVLRLIAAPGKILDGRICLNGTDILTLPERRVQREVRGTAVSMIFQEPMTSLNPLMTVGAQITEALRVHRGMSRRDAYGEAVNMLRRVGIASPEKRMDAYPHTLSGGMRQRVMIAIAMCCRPQLLIADEPTTALDVTIQAQILALMDELREETEMSILMITHDLGVVARMCDRVAVMYCGAIVEQGTATEILHAPQHPYTRGLIASIPDIKSSARYLANIPGTVPKIIGEAHLCRFADRCEYCTAACREKEPPLRHVSAGHLVRCTRYGEI